MRWSWKPSFTESHDKRSAHSDALSFGEGIKIYVVLDSNGVKIFNTSPPRPILVVVYFSRNCVLTVNLSSNEISQKTISFSNWTISKRSGSWEGTNWQRMLVSSLSERPLSWERASETLFSSPKTFGCNLSCRSPAFALRDLCRPLFKWWLVSAHLSFQKCVFLFQPLEVELSIIDRAQSPSTKRLLMMSTQGVILDPT